MGEVRPIRTREDLAREHFFISQPSRMQSGLPTGCANRGWAAQVGLGADDVNWLVFAQEPDPVRDMDELWDELSALAEEFNGWFDGYGSLG